MKTTAQRVTNWLIVASVTILGALCVVRVVSYFVEHHMLEKTAETVEISEVAGRQRALAEQASRLAWEPGRDRAALAKTLEDLNDLQSRLKKSDLLDTVTMRKVKSLDLSLSHITVSGNTIVESQDPDSEEAAKDAIKFHQQLFDKTMSDVVATLKAQSYERLAQNNSTSWLTLVFGLGFTFLAILIVAGPLRGRLSATLQQLEQAHSSAEDRAEELHALQIELEHANAELKDRHIKLRSAYDETTSTNQFLQLSSARFEDLFHGVPFACFSVDDGGQIFEWNEAASQMFGVAGHHAIQKSIFGKFFSLDNDFLLKGLIAEAFKGNHLRNIEIEADCPDGKRQLLLSVFPLRAARKEPTAALIACADITRQKDAEREAHLANDRVAAILRSIKDAFVTIDRDLVYRYVNHAAAQWMGLDVNEIVGRSVVEVSPNLRQSGLVERIERVIASGTADIFEQHDELNDVWFEYRAYPSEEGVSVFYNDITERKLANETIMKQQEQLETAMLRLSESSVQIEQSRMDLEEANRHLQELAVTDGLTGLLNHRAMQDELIIATNKSATWGLPVSVALLDVDHFKKFNDAFGHQAGDQVLKQLALHLRAAVREGDIVARYGGEEFCVVFPDTLAEDAAIVCERIRKQVESSEWEHRKVTVSIGFSSGVGVKDQQELIRQADQALYQAKAAGRNCVVPFRGESTRCA